MNKVLRKAVSWIMLILLFLVLMFDAQPVKVEFKIIVAPDDYPTIQEAINVATEGDTIFVRSGLYRENLIVNKTVLLVGENCKSTIIDGQQRGDVILITSSNVTVTNFKVINSSLQHCGIRLSAVQECAVSNCNISQNHFGILLYSSSSNTILNNSIMGNWEGIILDNSADNFICKNQITKNMDCGIYLYSSANNTLRNNWLTSNLGGGILIFSSPNSILKNNSISGSFANFGVWDADELLPNFIQDIDTSNTVDGKPIYYWVNEKNKKVPPDAGCVSLINSTNIIVENLNLTNNYHGILFFRTTNSSILNNNITANSYGIKLCYSSNNIISENRVLANKYGVRLDSSSNNNLVCNNHIVENTELYGILIDSSLNNTVCQNTIENDKSGILIWYYSHYNRVYRNNIRNNTLYGIVLRLYSNSNILSENNVVNNWCGIRIEDTSSNNIIYHNNFINNTETFDISELAINIWDNGYPSGGNFWSNHANSDLQSGVYQNVTGSDGIGDLPYVIDENNIDRYPLMASINVFDAGVWDTKACSVDIMSNSTLSNFNIDLYGKIISFNVTGSNGSGFCRITIPNIIVQSLWHGNYKVLLNGKPWPFRNWTDRESTYIHINYTHSTHKITIIPESPPILLLLLFMPLTMLTIVTMRPRKKQYTSSKRNP